jgi:hypothetical protein
VKRGGGSQGEERERREATMYETVYTKQGRRKRATMYETTFVQSILPPAAAAAAKTPISVSQFISLTPHT